MIRDPKTVLDALLEVGIDVRFEEDEIPGHSVIHLDVGGDTAVEQPGNLDHVEVCEEVNVFDPRDLGGDQRLPARLSCLHGKGELGYLTGSLGRVTWRLERRRAKARARRLPS